MEILIPGLILVALMAWASTRIKKRAADAWGEELIETENYSLRKPEGFLHVVGGSDDELRAYSRDFGEEDNSQVRRATIEVDVLRDRDLADVRKSIEENATSIDVATESEIIANETANQTPMTVFYKLIGSRSGVIRLRIAVIAEYKDQYGEQIASTIDSFALKTN